MAGTEVPPRIDVTAVDLCERSVALDWLSSIMVCQTLAPIKCLRAFSEFGHKPLDKRHRAIDAFE